MQTYRLTVGGGLKSLERQTRAVPELGAHDVQVRIHAVSLNYRDLMIANGQYPLSRSEPIVPTSDGAGEVVAVGSAVGRFRVGDRVFSTFFPKWTEGAQTLAKTHDATGGSVDGVLAEQVVSHEDGWVQIPSHLSYAEASTLTCAGVTAWNALFIEAALRPGESVLLLGTGGISIWGLQLAKAAGLQAIITSSSDDKLARARELGADGVVNYRTHPQWAAEVLRLTKGEGVNLVLEVGGTGTLSNSVDATAVGGTVAIIGGVSGFGGELEPFKLINGARRLSGVMVGSRAMAEDLARFVEINRICPVVDRVFGFDQAGAAFEHLAGARHFGKVVISVTA